MRIVNDIAALRTKLAPVYYRYNREPNPQNAYLWIDMEKETVEADYDSVIAGGGVSERVYHAFVRRVGISPYIKGTTLADLLESKELAGYVQRIIDGFESVWDGNNHVAKLTDDAQSAERDLELHVMHAIDPTDQATVYTADEWIDNVLHTDEAKATIDIPLVGTISADSTDIELEAMANQMRDDAASEGIYLEPRVFDTLDELRTRCAKMREEQED